MSTDMDIVGRLRRVEGLKDGIEFPRALAEGDWGVTICGICGDAAAEIEHLRAEIEHLRQIAGAASIELPLMTFADIKKEIKP